MPDEFLPKPKRAKGNELQRVETLNRKSQIHVLEKSNATELQRYLRKCQEVQTVD